MTNNGLYGTLSTPIKTPSYSGSVNSEIIISVDNNDRIISGALGEKTRSDIQSALFTATQSSAKLASDLEDLEELVKNYHDKQEKQNAQLQNAIDSEEDARKAAEQEIKDKIAEILYGLEVTKNQLNNAIATNNSTLSNEIALLQNSLLNTKEQLEAKDIANRELFETEIANVEQNMQNTINNVNTSVGTLASSLNVLDSSLHTVEAALEDITALHEKEFQNLNYIVQEFNEDLEHTLTHVQEIENTIDNDIRNQIRNLEIKLQEEISTSISNLDTKIEQKVSEINITTDNLSAAIISNDEDINTLRDEDEKLQTEIDKLNNNKADKAITLAGYGINDAYTKSQVDAKFTDLKVDKISQGDVKYFLSNIGQNEGKIAVEYSRITARDVKNDNGQNGYGANVQQALNTIKESVGVIEAGYKAADTSAAQKFDAHIAANEIKISELQQVDADNKLAIEALEQRFSAHVTRTIVESLDTITLENVDYNTIYMVKQSRDIENDIYDEYLAIKAQEDSESKLIFELIGNTQFVLDNYYTKDQIDINIGVAVETIEAEITNKINPALETKADKNDTYTKDEVYNKDEIDNEVKTAISNVQSTITNTINPVLEKKADKATTLAGYNIADAYNKKDINVKFDALKSDNTSTAYKTFLYNVAQADGTITSSYARITTKDVKNNNSNSSLGPNLYEALEKIEETNDTVAARLTELNDLINSFHPLQFTSDIKLSPSMVEIQTEPTITVSWSMNRKPSKITANDIDVSEFGQSSEGVAAVSYTYDWRASQGAERITVNADGLTKGAVVTFTNYVYWGVAGQTIDTLSSLAEKKLSTKSAIGNVSLTIEGDNYFWYAVPDTYAEPLFKVGGFEGGVTRQDATITTDKNVVYKLYRSNQPNLGSTTFNIS